MKLERLKIISLGTAVWLGLAASVSAEKIDFREVPAKAQLAVRAYAGTAQIEDVDRMERDGKVVYEVAFKRDGRHVELQVDQRGEVLGGAEDIEPLVPLERPAGDVEGKKATGERTEGRRAATQLEPVRMIRVPPQVRASIEQEAEGQRVEAMFKRPAEVYVVEFNRDNQRGVLTLTEEGNVIKGDVYDMDAQFDRPLAGATKVELDQVPEEVREAIQAQARGSRIEDIDKGRLGGRTAYQAAFKADGVHTEIRVSEEGQVLAMEKRGQGISRFGYGKEEQMAFHSVPVRVKERFQQEAPEGEPVQVTKAETTLYVARLGGDESAQEGQEGQEENELKILKNGMVVQAIEAGEYQVPLAGARKVHWFRVPEAVRETIRQEAGGAAIEDLEVGTWSGRTVYQAAFKENGRHRELQVTEDGSIVRGVAGAGNR